MPVWPDEPKTAFECFEKATGLTLSVHDLAGAFYRFLPPAKTIHDTPCCRAVKARLDKGLCIAFDQRYIRAKLESDPQPGIKLCHAGLVEWYAPVMHEGGLAAVLFAGQRRPSARLIDLTLDPNLKGKTPPKLAKIAAVTPSTAAYQLEMLTQLAARLTLWLDAMHRRLDLRDQPRQTNREPPTRRAIIYRFIHDRHTRPATLGQLARRLHLSPSRTAHVVVEITGHSFMALLTEARVATAAAMLRHTDLNVEEVGRRAGFPNASHFHRTFRRCMNHTPAVYRRLGV